MIYWIKGLNIIGISNSRIFQVSEENLEELESAQNICDFDENCYGINIFTQSYNQDNTFLISLAICSEPPRDQYKSEYLTPFLNFDEAATWLMKVKLNKMG